MASIYSGTNLISGYVDLSNYAKKNDVKKEINDLLNIPNEQANEKLNEIMGTIDTKYFE